MKDNFDMKKFLAENKLGAYARLKEENNKESEANVLREWDPEDSDIIIPNKSRSDKNFFNKIVVPLLNKMLNTGKEPGPDVFGKYKPSGKRANWYYEDYGDKILINVNKDLDIDTDTLQAKIDKLYSQHVKSNPVKETEDLANADEISMEEEVDEAISLKPKKYYQILDQGTNEWHDEYQYIGKVDYGSTVGEEGEHMFILPTSPGNFIFNSVPETDLDSLVKPSMDEGKKVEEPLDEASNPEGDKLVMRFLQGIAKRNN
jgi:hypothetical protein